MTSRQHVSFGRGGARGQTSQHGNEATDCEGGPAGLRCGARPNKSGDLGPLHQSAACSKNACQILYQRLEPIRKQNPGGSWESWVSKAFFQKISLLVTGFYRGPDLYMTGRRWQSSRTPNQSTRILVKM